MHCDPLMEYEHEDQKFCVVSFIPLRHEEKFFKHTYYGK